MQEFHIDGMSIDVLLGNNLLNTDNYVNNIDQDSITQDLENKYYKQLTRKIYNVPNKDKFISANIGHFFDENPVWDYFYKIDFDSILDQNLPDYIKRFNDELSKLTLGAIKKVNITKWYISSYGSTLNLKITCKNGLIKQAIETIRENPTIFPSVIKGKAFTKSPKVTRRAYKDTESFIRGWEFEEVTNEELIEQYINLIFRLERFENTALFEDFYVDVMAEVERKITKLIYPDFEKFFSQLLN